MIISRTPLRISLGGGGTDLYQWYSKYESFFISAAINKYIYVTLNERSLKKDFWISYSKIENFKEKKFIKHSIISEILKKKKFKNGLEIHSISEVPSGSGLGSSGALTVGLIKNIIEYEKNNLTKQQVAEMAVDIEMKLNKKNAGKQDQFISTYGGIKCFKINKKGQTLNKIIKIPNDNLINLKENLFIVYTDEKRDAEKIIKKQSNIINKFKNKNYLMSEIQKIGYETYEVFKSKNMSSFGELLDRHWSIKKKFGDFMTSCKIDDDYENFKQNGASGGKIIGAGGGGFFMLYAKQKNKLEKFLKDNNYRMLNWDFDYEGSKILLNSFKKK